MLKGEGKVITVHVGTVEVTVDIDASGFDFHAHVKFPGGDLSRIERRSGFDRRYFKRGRRSLLSGKSANRKQRQGAEFQ